MSIFGRRRRERTLFFPWERRGLARAFTMPGRRATAWMVVAAAVALLAWFVDRDRAARSLRVTRAAIDHARGAIDLYRADHAGRCPRDLDELVAPGDKPAYLTTTPIDAWKRPLRFACPSRDPNRAYDLASDGPDGEPSGLDRIE